MPHVSSKPKQEKTTNSDRIFLFGGISLLKKSDDSDRLPDLMPASVGKVFLERDMSDTRSVYRKNSQKRRSPSFRTPPCEREMLKNWRSKKSNLYSSTPDLCRPVGFPKNVTGGSAAGRPSVKQMIHNFEIVGSTVGNFLEDKIVAKAADIPNSPKADHSQFINSIKQQKSTPIIPSCMSNSIDIGFYSDSNCTDGFNTEQNKNKKITSFQSSTTLCLLPTASSFNSFYQENPLYGSLPRVKNSLKSSQCKESLPTIEKVTNHDNHLKRTQSNKCESYSDYVSHNKCKTLCLHADTTSTLNVNTSTKNVIEIDPVSSNNLGSGPQEDGPGKKAVPATLRNGTFIARWVQVEDQ